ncbi:hypothetical protein EPIRMAN_GEN20615_11745 [Ralstonia mannitolilytica]|uniref:Uncharacterized protein n=1 Tax=Ralstonia mannitolilytica TaxID=105219 RepID=A0AAJ4ZPM7_9RALS|nr:hypothetical protein LMG6866_00104 [Ralstonia mannitolilytica]CAJ0729986.1 hypothetical protein R76706_02220 [Ralstonia mannitolilytica]CAJ0735893.1 hypothetical protein R77592_03907 [Ralstonia mannitolilytica]CAJ0790136.1 hypothetical protein R77555_02000 [Ralstonia mannitolilytica]SUE24352.1 Uncharacterised protein [Ralstonia mannitolilytica]
MPRTAAAAPLNSKRGVDDRMHEAQNPTCGVENPVFEVQNLMKNVRNAMV